MRSVRTLAAAVLSLLAVSSPALAAKQGGILRVYHRDSPGSASIHEGATYSVNVPFMPVFNNLVIYKQDVAQNSLESIVPELVETHRIDHRAIGLWQALEQRQGFLAPAPGRPRPILRRGR